MPLYETGMLGGGGGLQVGGSNHSHSGWENPVKLSNTQFKVTKGNYLPGELTVGLSAEPLGEEGMTVVHSPAYTETDPSNGIFSLAQDLPDGWILKVKYTFF